MPRVVIAAMPSRSAASGVRAAVLQQAGEGGVDPFEQRRLVLVLLRVDDRCRQLVARAAGAAEVLDRRPALALVHAGGHGCPLHRSCSRRAGRSPRCRSSRTSRSDPPEAAEEDRPPRQPVPPQPVPPAACPRRRRTARSAAPASSTGTAWSTAPEAAAARLIQLLHLPRPQSLLQLLGKLRRIRRRGERFERQRRRHLVMLAAAGAGRIQRHHDVGTDRADHPDEVAEDLVVTPLLDRLLRAEREPEVDGAREVLLGPVPAVRLQQLLGPQHADGVEELRTDLVLPAVPARGGERGRRACPAPARRAPGSRCSRRRDAPSCA